MTSKEKEFLKFKIALFLFMVIFAFACLLGCRAPLMVYNHNLPDTIIVYHNVEADLIPYHYK